MRKLLIILGGTALITASAVTYAQHGNVSEKVARMTERLQLNSTQVTQVTTIMEEQQTKRAALREETKTKLKAVLNEEQIEKMEKMRSMHEKMRDGKGRKCMNKQ